MSPDSTEESNNKEQDELTGRDILNFLRSARCVSLDAMKLARAAQWKWYEMHQGTTREREAFESSGTMTGANEDYMKEVEASGGDSAKVMAAIKAKSDAELKRIIYEWDGVSKEEADEVWNDVVQQDQENSLYIEALTQRIKAFMRDERED